MDRGIVLSRKACASPPYHLKVAAVVECYLDLMHSAIQEQVFSTDLSSS